jgi:hypothetical protein
MQSDYSPRKAKASKTGRQRTRAKHGQGLLPWPKGYACRHSVRQSNSHWLPGIARVHDTRLRNSHEGAHKALVPGSQSFVPTTLPR